MFKQFLAGTAVLLALSGAAMAGEQYVDETGFAISGYDAVAYFSLAQKDAGMMQPHAVPGRAEFTAEYNGAKWAFATAENRDMFVADPAKFAPKYDGHCAFGVAKGAKVPANPNLWRIVDGSLYLNLNPDIAETWNSDIADFIVDANEEWPGLESDSASDDSWMQMSENEGTYDMAGPVK
jgi:YHS domain-containing protein